MAGALMWRTSAQPLRLVDPGQRVALEAARPGAPRAGPWPLARRASSAAMRRRSCTYQRRPASRRPRRPRLSRMRTCGIARIRNATKARVASIAEMRSAAQAARREAEVRSRPHGKHAAPAAEPGRRRHTRLKPDLVAISLAHLGAEVGQTVDQAKLERAACRTRTRR